MKISKAVMILNDIKRQYEDCVRIANSRDAEDFQKESLKDNEEAVTALDMAIKALRE